MGYGLAPAIILKRYATPLLCVLYHAVVGETNRRMQRLARAMAVMCRQSALGAARCWPSTRTNVSLISTMAIGEKIRQKARRRLLPATGAAAKVSMRVLNLK